MHLDRSVVIHSIRARSVTREQRDLQQIQLRQSANRSSQRECKIRRNIVAFLNHNAISPKNCIYREASSPHLDPFILHCIVCVHWSIFICIWNLTHELRTNYCPLACTTAHTLMSMRNLTHELHTNQCPLACTTAHTQLPIRLPHPHKNPRISRHLDHISSHTHPSKPAT